MFFGYCIYYLFKLRFNHIYFLLFFFYQEADEVLNIIKLTWPLLGITQKLHSSLYGWILFQQVYICNKVCFLFGVFYIWTSLLIFEYFPLILTFFSLFLFKWDLCLQHLVFWLTLSFCSIYVLLMLMHCLSSSAHSQRVFIKHNSRSYLKLENK